VFFVVVNGQRWEKPNVWELIVKKALAKEMTKFELKLLLPHCSTLIGKLIFFSIVIFLWVFF